MAVTKYKLEFLKVDIDGNVGSTFADLLIDDVVPDVEIVISPQPKDYLLVNFSAWVLTDVGQRLPNVDATPKLESVVVMMMSALEKSLSYSWSVDIDNVDRSQFRRAEAIVNVKASDYNL